MCKTGEVGGSSASELRAEELSLQQAKLVKRKSVDPLNARMSCYATPALASERARQSTAAHIMKTG